VDDKRQNIGGVIVAPVKKEIEQFGPVLREYASLLSSLNERARVTGPADPSVIMDDHIADCAWSLSQAPEKGSVVDLGTGGGLPGIVWAICRPGLRVTLLESVGKKCRVLEEIVSAMGLSNVEIACARSETLARNKREAYGILLSRAVGHLGIVAEYGSPLVQKGGFALVFKGPKVIDEIGEVGERWSELGFGEPELWPYNHQEKNLYLVKMIKQKPCPDRFPRNPGKANKSVWWR
jgi:16S rRNA (guanine527-N7)-methyltransferase